MIEDISKFYNILKSHFGSQNWWPFDNVYHKINASDPRFEIMIGAILTQNTAWINVEKALYNLYFAEAKLMLGQSNVEDRIKYSLSYFKNNHDDRNFARAKFLHGYLLISMGEYNEAKEDLIEAYAGFKKCEDYYGQAWSLSRLAFISYHCGDAISAVSHYRQQIPVLS